MTTPEEATNGIRSMLATIRALGTEPAALMIHSRREWERLMGPWCPMVFDGLHVIPCALTPVGEVLAIGPEVVEAVKAGVVPTELAPD